MEGYIDAILYINLEERKDRNESVLREISKICKDPSKIHRIDAIKAEPGILGCGLSHLKAVNYAYSHENWKTVLILEDDFTFKGDNSNTICDKIKQLLENSEKLDVGLLSYNHEVIRWSNTNNENIKRVLYSQTASSYIAKRHYIPSLIQNFTESTTNMKHSKGKRSSDCVDIYWAKLMPIANWFAIYPALGYQRESYSDIERRVVNYGC